MSLSHLTDRQWEEEIALRRDRAALAFTKEQDPVKARRLRARRDHYQGMLTMGRAAVLEAHRKRLATMQGQSA